MNGGKISNNGTGVSISSNGTFTMNGGIISDNAGRGVNARPSGETAKTTIIMSNGKISGNKGGGVFVVRGTFTMSNGEIYDNTSNGDGGGVNVGGYGTFTMSGGEIYDNTSNGNGGGVYVSSIMTLYKLWIKPFKFNSCVFR